MSQSRLVFGLAALILFLAFSFQGTRGIWEPDEGFYIGAARNMVETGDWVVPQVNLRPFLEKPPLMYWGSGLGMLLFGFNEWGARLAHALWFSLAALLTGLLAASMWDKRSGVLASLVYATMILPFFSANIVTPDTPLAFWVTAVAFCFWKSLAAEDSLSRHLYRLGFAVSLGVGVLAKGPAILVFLPPLALYLIFTKQVGKFLLRWDFPVLVLIAALIGGSWYVMIYEFVPGALAYAWDNQVIGRLFTDKYDRNPEFYKPIVIYLPVLLVGTLPWSLSCYSQLGSLRSPGRTWRSRLFASGQRPGLFLGLWIIVPVLIFCAARSRLILYLLPVFPALAILCARCWIAWRPAWFSDSIPRKPVAIFATWCLALLAIKAFVAHMPTERDTRAFWEAIRRELPNARYELVVVTGRRHGLSFYSGGNVEWVTTHSDPYPFFHLPEPLEMEIHELRTSAEHHVFLAREKDYGWVKQAIEATGTPYEEKPGPYEWRMLICSPAPDDARTVHLAAMGDTRSGDPRQIQLGSALNHVDAALTLNGVLLLGDNLSFDGDPRFFDDHISQPYNALIKNGVPFFAVLGNHDVDGGFAGFQINHPFFNMNGRRYYSRVFGDNLVQGFVLDSNTLPGDEKQLEWLRKELGQSSAAWKVVGLHYPIYGRSKEHPEPDAKLREALEPILVDGGVDIVLAGHCHVYQRLRPKNGIQYFIAGSGGELDEGSLSRDDPDLIAGNDETTIALVLTFTPKECRFQAINGIEQVIDEGSIPIDPKDRMGDEAWGDPEFHLAHKE
ncbi:MAG: glycosyltransferase family 39 protein [Candidatus Omnitrophica bacterium]|nr:glycosyltransferase family 39 protein [Candidatus Omnitrophota bacterium]